MKIVFNGTFEKVGKKRCNCKRQGNSEYGFVTTRMYILPSGITKTFVQGRAETVSDSDGSFLLSYNGTDVNGHYREVFTKAE